MRNPITPELEQAVIDSALRFARFLQRRIQSEGGNFTSGDVRFTRYREARSGTILHGVV